MEEKFTRNPFGVMIDPRGFIREALQHRKTSGWLLSGMLGLVWLFGRAYMYGLGDRFSFWWVFLGCVVFAIPVGYALIYLISFVLYWTGKIFGGKASYEEVWEAFLWTRVPEFFMILSWIGLMAIYGRMAFSPQFMYAPVVPMFVLGLIATQALFSVWEVIILLHALGEVQGLSAWVTIWNVLFTFIIMMILDGIFNWIVGQFLIVKPLAFTGFMFGINYFN